MQATFLARKFALIYRRGLRQRVASLTLDCNGVFTIKAYRAYSIIIDACTVSRSSMKKRLYGNARYHDHVHCNTIIMCTNVITFTCNVWHDLCESVGRFLPSDHYCIDTVVPPGDHYCIDTVVPSGGHRCIETVPPSSDHYGTTKVAPPSDHLHSKTV